MAEMQKAKEKNDTKARDMWYHKLVNQTKILPIHAPKFEKSAFFSRWIAAIEYKIRTWYNDIIQKLPIYQY